MRIFPALVLFAGCVSTRAVTPTPTPAQHVTLVSAVSNLGLFEEEEDRARDVLAKWLTTQGLSSVTRESPVFKGLALAKQGKHALTGVSCGRPLAQFEAARRWKTELGIDGMVNANVWCPKDGICELTVNELRLEPSDGPLEKWQATIDEKAEALDAFERAVSRLAPPVPKDGAGVGGLLTGRAASVVAADTFSVRVFHADMRARDGASEVAAPFPTLTNEEVLACMGNDDNSDGALFELDATGALGRCEVDNAHTCLCELISSTTRSPELHGARWNARFHIQRRSRLNADGRLTLSASWNRYSMKGARPQPGRSTPLVEMVNDPSLRGWSPPPERLVAGCFENRAQAERLSSRWQVTFDDVGKVAKVDAVKTSWAPLDVDTAACVARLLRTSVAPCPARGGVAATVDLHVTLEAPNGDSVRAP
ncbi:MAG: hypothetical protein ACO1OB_14085 [Archangium sp.]